MKMKGREGAAAVAAELLNQPRKTLAKLSKLLFHVVESFSKDCSSRNFLVVWTRILNFSLKSNL